MRLIISRPLLCLATAVLSLSGCGGGGGGGGDFIGAAIVSVSTSPETIDPGDRTLVRVNIEQVHPNGIALKVKLPTALVYVTGSALLKIDGDELDATPTVNRADDSSRYLVYYLRQSLFGENGSGELTFELEGVDEVSEGEIGVDADVDDPDKPNTTEFSISSPEFGAEDAAFIRVVD